MTRLTLPVILALAAPVHAQSQKLVIADPPEPATVEGFEPGHCVALRNRIRICKVLSETDALLLVEKEGKTLGTWRAALNSVRLRTLKSCAAISMLIKGRN